MWVLYCMHSFGCWLQCNNCLNAMYGKIMENTCVQISCLLQHCGPKKLIVMKSRKVLWVRTQSEFVKRTSWWLQEECWRGHGGVSDASYMILCSTHWLKALYKDLCYFHTLAHNSQIRGETRPASNKPAADTYRGTVEEEITDAISQAQVPLPLSSLSLCLSLFPCLFPSCDSFPPLFSSTGCCTDDSQKGMQLSIDSGQQGVPHCKSAPLFLGFECPPLFQLAGPAIQSPPP